MAEITREPDLRVRLATGLPSVTVSGTGAIELHDGRRRRTLEPPLRVQRRGGQILVSGRGSADDTAFGPALTLSPAAGSPTLTVDRVAGERRSYPGRLSFHAREGRDGLELINTVQLEDYLPGVLEKELVPDWHDNAFRAQAVAARSYALWERSRNRAKGRAYDVHASTASQVYGGVTRALKPRQAVRATRGQVLVWDAAVVPAYFSSTAGTRGADGAKVWPQAAPDIPPLRGRDYGAWDARSPRYRWPEVSRPADGVARQLAAWGQRRKHPVAELKGLTGIRLVERHRSGRPATFRLTDAAGRTADLGADDLRHVFNDVEGQGTAYSGDFVPDVNSGRLTLRDGRGFGHGVGLSQFGAQAMAQAGHPVQTILGAYYPGATIHRAYR